MQPAHRWLLALILLLATLGLTGVAFAQGGGDPARGGELYVENCAVCHGADGQGRIGASLDDFPGIAIDAAMRQTIATGISGSAMPAWSEARGGPLSDADIDDIVAYITSAIGGTDPIAPVPEYQPPAIEPLPDIAGDPSLGAVVYQQNCVMCHGESGGGRFGAPLAKSWPGNQPEVYINQVVSQGIVGSPMPAWSTDAGGPLSAQEIENVTAYVLSLAPIQGAATPTEAPQGPLGQGVSLLLFVLAGVALLIILVAYYRRGADGS